MNSASEYVSLTEARDMLSEVVGHQISIGTVRRLLRESEPPIEIIKTRLDLRKRLVRRADIQRLIAEAQSDPKTVASVAVAV